MPLQRIRDLFKYLLFIVGAPAAFGPFTHDGSSQFHLDASIALSFFLLEISFLLCYVCLFGLAEISVLFFFYSVKFFFKGSL